MCGFLRSERGRRRLAGGAVFGQWRAWGGAASAAPHGAAMNDPRCLTVGPRGARPRERQGPSPHGTAAPTASGDTRDAHQGRQGAMAMGPSGRSGTPRVPRGEKSHDKGHYQAGQAAGTAPGLSCRSHRQGQPGAGESRCPPHRAATGTREGAHAQFLRVACREL